MHPELSQSGVAAVPAAQAKSNWQTLDKIGSYLFAAFVILGGICTPLGLAIYSLVFRQ